MAPAGASALGARAQAAAVGGATTPPFGRWQAQMEGHSDAIMDCAYNFHGTRLATCAADRKIIVWDQSADGQWTHSCAPLERHTSAVYKVDWAHPEFGQVIASCSADRTVIVWEETQNRWDPTQLRCRSACAT